MDADELYRLPREEFTATRDAAAKQRKAAGDPDGAKALKALRRPSVSARLVNLLAGQEPDLLEQLLELGPALALAQATGQGEELRALGAQRRELIGAVTSRAVQLGGRDVATAVRDEVAATLETALADPGSAEAVRSGRLVRALSYAGFGGVDLDGAVAAAGSPKPKKQKTDQTADRTAAAEAAALEVAGRLDDAVRACERAERVRGEAQEQVQRAHDDLARLRAALRAAEQQAQAAEAQARNRDEAAAKAVEAVRRAQDAADAARVELDRLRRT